MFFKGILKKNDKKQKLKNTIFLRKKKHWAKSFFWDH